MGDFTEFRKKLESEGYKCTRYYDNSNGNGVAYYENEDNILKITYEWIKAEENHYEAGNIFTIEDVTECY